MRSDSATPERRADELGQGVGGHQQADGGRRRRGTARRRPGGSAARGRSPTRSSATTDQIDPNPRASGPRAVRSRPRPVANVGGGRVVKSASVAGGSGATPGQRRRRAPSGVSSSTQPRAAARCGGGRPRPSRFGLRAASRAGASASALGVGLGAAGSESQAERGGDLEDGGHQRRGVVPVLGGRGGVGHACPLEHAAPAARRGVEVVVHAARNAATRSASGARRRGRARPRWRGAPGDRACRAWRRPAAAWRRVTVMRRAVVGLQHQQPVGARVAALEQVEQAGDVAQRLRHLLAALVDDQAVVHPVAWRTCADGDGLGPLVLVVREREVQAAAVQVEALAEQVEAHHDALGVPARTAVAPRATATSARRAWPSSTARSRAGGASRRPPSTVDRARPPARSDVERLVGQQAVAVDRTRPRSRRRRPSRRRGRARRARRSARPSARRRPWRGGRRRDAATPRPSMAVPPDLLVAGGHVLGGDPSSVGLAR